VITDPSRRQAAASDVSGCDEVGRIATRRPADRGFGPTEPLSHVLIAERKAIAGRSQADPPNQWDVALEQPGSATASTLRNSVGFALAILLSAGAVMAVGRIQLAAFPQFTTFQTAFVFVVDAITGWMLLGQFHYRRRPSYAALASAYLFNAMVMVPFLLSFPGALQATGSVIGSGQSSIWVWHAWHLIFPVLVILALIIEYRFANIEMPDRNIIAVTAAAIGVPLALVAVITAVVTETHDLLPPLIDDARRPVGPNFYIAGGVVAALTTVALLISCVRGWRRLTILHLWLAVALAAFLADIAASLSATGRYTLGWYLGRVESMIAGSVLLLLFVRDLNRLYQRLAGLMRDLSSANARLLAVVAEKDAVVSDLQRSEEKVRQLAYYDTLTNLPNRRLLLDRLAQAVAQARRHDHSMAIMFVDLDRFKEINDALGHDVGDALLSQVAARLTGCVRSSDTVSRSGGDEFIVVLAEIAHPHDAARVAEKVIRAIDAPVGIGDQWLQVTASIGIAIYPDDDRDDVRELLKKADQAMYVAKRAGRNTYRFYSDGAQLRVG